MTDSVTTELYEALSDAIRLVYEAEEAFSRYWHFDHSMMEIGHQDVIEAYNVLKKAQDLTRTALGEPKEAAS
ncbi:MAG: hypothetical protein IJS28_07160 [Synergistaceae bacterium]|nr:hypothetical protein [Synergistaceae bacterium]